MKHILLAFLFIVAAAAVAQPGGGPDRKELMEKLKLNPQQQEQMKTIYKETARQMIDLRSEMQKKRIDMSDIMDADKPDRGKFERLSQDIAGVQVKIKLSLFDADQKVRAILDPEQQKIWKSYKEHRFEMLRERFMQGMGGGPGKGGPGKCGPGEGRHRQGTPETEDDD
jgi:Spy/CpxP family protein refolding chaperone